jgi:hypothetical protein
MSTRSRRWLFAVLALAVMAGAGFVGFLAFAEDEWKAARRRVPRGADREAAEAAVGRPADHIIGKAGGSAESSRRMVFWDQGKDQLGVEFDEDGRAVKADVYRWEPTGWERFRAWLGWQDEGE